MAAKVGWAVAAAVAALAAEAGAQEWTRFRGPNGTGVSAARGVPVQWGPSDYVWRVPIPGRGDAQPVLWGDRIFLPTASEDGREWMLLCLRASDGKELWARKVPMPAYDKGRNPTYASSTPAVDKDRVYALCASSAQFLVKAFDHEGKELWTVNLGPVKAQHGHGGSPILYEGKLIVPNDQDGESFVVALDVRTGRTVWRAPRRPKEQGAAYSTPCVLERKGFPPELLLTSEAHGISSLDPRTGAALWEARVFDKRAVSSPVVADHLVFGTCGSGGGGMFLAAVKLGGRGDVTSTHQAYAVRTGAPYVPTPLAVGERLFTVSDNGVATCLEAATGRVIWSERLGGAFYASPVWVEGKIYCPSKQGECAVWEAADAFKVVARNPLGEGTHTPPAVSAGRLYFRTFTHLVCVGAK
jgi:outer membrane protein assembly factor BamB